jgi:hypothetical protein
MNHNLQHLTKICRASRCYYLALIIVRLQWSKRDWAKDTHLCATLEDNRLMAGAFAIGKCTHCLGRLIRVSSEEVIESFMPKLF